MFNQKFQSSLVFFLLSLSLFFYFMGIEPASFVSLFGAFSATIVFGFTSFFRRFLLWLVDVEELRTFKNSNGFNPDTSAYNDR